MAVRLVSAVCPSCGAQIEIPPDRATCYCTYCGSQIMLDDGSQTINIHNFDEAELRRVELEAQELKRLDEVESDYERRHRAWRLAVAGWVALLIALFVITELVDNDALVTAAGAILVFGPIALLVLRPRRPRRRR